MPTEAIASATMPSFTTRPSTSMPSAPTPAHTTTSTMPVATIRPGVASIPASVSAQGAPR